MRAEVGRSLSANPFRQVPAQSLRAVYAADQMGFRLRGAAPGMSISVTIVDDPDEVGSREQVGAIALYTNKYEKNTGLSKTGFSQAVHSFIPMPGKYRPECRLDSRYQRKIVITHLRCPIQRVPEALISHAMWPPVRK